MMKLLKTTVLAAVFCLGSGLQAGAGDTTKFTVQGVPARDHLNVRDAPHAAADVTGKLWNSDEGFVSLVDCWDAKTARKVPPAKVKWNRPNLWCSVMGGPDGDIRGYVRTKFIRF